MLVLRWLIGQEPHIKIKDIRVRVVWWLLPWFISYKVFFECHSCFHGSHPLWWLPVHLSKRGCLNEEVCLTLGRALPVLRAYS